MEYRKLVDLQVNMDRLSFGDSPGAFRKLPIKVARSGDRFYPVCYFVYFFAHPYGELTVWIAERYTAHHVPLSIGTHEALPSAKLAGYADLFASRRVCRANSTTAATVALNIFLIVTAVWFLVISAE
jgi:hypothetical protein